MRVWLEQYLKDKYKGYEIITLDTSQERLDRALKRYDIINDMATGVDIQIDVLGIARKKNNVKLFFIEAKKTKLTLRDLGQLWAYCKLIDPEEAFLFSSAEYSARGVLPIRALIPPVHDSNTGCLLS